MVMVLTIHIAYGEHLSSPRSNDQWILSLYKNQGPLIELEHKMASPVNSFDPSP